MMHALVGNTHIVAGGSEMIPAIFSLLAREGFETAHNPDLYVRTYASFGIDEARELRERASARALHGRRAFIVVTPNMTTEAQNALLKTLEEPRANALFFLVVQAPQTLLATLRSRCQILSLFAANESDVEEREEATAFLAASPTRRLELLKPILEKGENDMRDMQRMIRFLSALERTLASHVTDASMQEGIAAVYRARKYLSDKGALLKPILEQVALLIPMVQSRP